MTNDRLPSATPAPLLADAAFIVHLTDNKAALTEGTSGRVEHVTSGRSMRFASITQLMEFMQRVLASNAGGERVNS